MEVWKRTLRWIWKTGTKYREESQEWAAKEKVD